MTLFWANLLCVAWALPFLVSVFFFVQTWDYLALAGMVIGLAILGPGFTALTHICMQLVRDKHVFLWHAYWGSVKRDWKQSVIFALMVGALWGTLAYAVRLVSGHIVKDFVSGGGDAVLLHQVLGEDLAALDDGGFMISIAALSDRPNLPSVWAS